MRISDVLREKGHDVVTVEANTTLKIVVGILSSKHIGAVVVLDRLKPSGIFSERDLVNVLASHGAAGLELTIAGVMSHPIIAGHPEDRIEAAMAVMTRERIRHLPVLDSGKLVGLISIGDVVKHRLMEKELEADVMRDIARMRS